MTSLATGFSTWMIKYIYHGYEMNRHKFYEDFVIRGQLIKEAKIGPLTQAPPSSLPARSSLRLRSARRENFPTSLEVPGRFTVS
ncbi:hypothetical protein ALC56_07782 [Trachymyrmex septentrionalis]|uniref:Uncharacterized protein n=1 Tax=Trachymyrmex septentrionalis TaxID=34720 RepID=A0A195FAX5_9HYME|nr:hypothetical protein ALC56_07782 [Trachymyrmex septentrionalis]